MEKKKDGNKSVSITDPKTGYVSEYSMSIRLKRNLDEKVIPDLQKKDKDCFLVIDGSEGCSPKGTKVMMSNGSWKNIEDIKLNDIILSPQLNGEVIKSKIIRLFKYKNKNTFDIVDIKTNKKLYSCSENHYIPIFQDEIKEYQTIQLFQFQNPIKTFIYNPNKKIIEVIEVKLIKSTRKDVYGFTVDSPSHWYITNNYVITKNSGKSFLAFQIAKYVDPSFNLSRVIFSAEDFRDAILKAKKGQCVVYDEAFTGLSSRASLSMINKVLISLTMQMRQKNLFIIIVLPSYFLLDKYIALFRARALVHVYESHGRRGYFILYNKKLKKYLYLAGQKTYSYHHKTVRSNFRGRFYGKFALGDDKVEKLYRKKKMKALEQTEFNPMSAGQAKYKTQRDVLLWRLRKEMKMTYQEMETYLNEYDLIMNYSQVRNICVKFGDRAEEKKEKDIENKNKLKETKKIKVKSELIKSKEIEEEEFDKEFDENQVNLDESEDLDEDFE